ncbi:ATP-binding domain-containing protein [Aerococcus sp. UMB8487]|nr:ATP-binding domain-containing protein [Aerococcus sp. UMB8487]MDK6939431.1 ATP-binding domain-containing protein [Aerococcus sp. UMB8487]
MILNPGENGKNEPEKDFKNIKYRNFVQSRPGKQKARGSAGSGKTTLLAKRVANAAERLETNQAILVTYFNITIGNYLHDKIVAEAGKNLHELGVDLQHFNSLFRWKRDGNRYWIASLKEIDKKYQAIFIDEGQDFEYEWFKVLEASYLAGDGEFVIFADQNQNIYGQKMEQQVDDTSMTYQLPRTPIPGRWNSFDISHRHSNPMITTLANHFVDAYLDKTISISDDGIFINEDETLASQKIIYNYSAHDFDADLAAREVYRYMEAVGNADSNFSINDLAVLSTDRKLLRSLENKMRAMGEIFKDISTTFPPISDIDDSKYQNLDQKTDYDKPYKMKFYRNTGVVKMSTIHSFKGWESPYVVLVIPSRKNLSEDERVKRHDLIYTGITRAKKGIYILNYDPAYHDFFRQLS